MKNIIIWLIEAYQKTPSRYHSSCVFIPTCSEYTKQAVIRYGLIYGLLKGCIRILRCHPWQKQHYDPLV